MERYLYFCPKCHFLGSAGHENPNDYQQCGQCKNASMIFTGLTKEEWDNKTKEEKDLLKEQFATELVNASSMGKSGIDNDAILMSLEKMGKDISTIKTIMVVWAVLTIIGFLIRLISSASILAWIA